MNSADFLDHFFFPKNSFGNIVSVSYSLDLDIMSGLIWVQTVCKGYQQTTLVGSELIQNL